MIHLNILDFYFHVAAKTWFPMDIKFIQML